MKLSTNLTKLVASLAARPGGVVVNDPALAAFTVVQRGAAIQRCVRQRLIKNSGLKVGHQVVYTPWAEADPKPLMFVPANAAPLRKPHRGFAADATVTYPASYAFTRCPGFAPRQHVELPFATGLQRGRVV